MTNRALIIGYGNTYRRDDGVGLHVVNALRQRLGRSPLQQDEDGLDDLGYPVDTLVLHQLLPELSESLAHYQRVIFVDAHTGGIQEDVRIVQVAEEYGFQAVTHHMSPGMLLTLARLAGGEPPDAYLISVKGDDFDYGTELSEACRARADQAVEEVLALLSPLGLAEYADGV